MVQPPFYLSIAVPVPLPKVFDYLPLPQTDLSDYQAGLRVRIPFGGQTLVGTIVDIPQHSDVPLGKAKPINELIDSKPLLPQDLFRLGHWISEYYHQPLGECFDLLWPVLLRKGQSAETSLSRFWQRSIHLTSTSESITDVMASLSRAPRQQALYKQLEEGTLYAPKQIADWGYTPSVIQGLSTKGLINAVDKPSFEPIKGLNEAPPRELNQEQADALEMIRRHNAFQTYLLDGVTGSGKTEVYLQAIAPVIERGQQALVLVPEIGLTPQTIRRFSQRFDADILVLHSGLNPRERLDAWLCALNAKGERGQIIIGTRSAVFTPLPHLGIIVIDEEHDASFKQQEGVRYHGRDVAVVRGKQRNIPVILGSATPSLDSLHNALNQKYQHLKLTERAGDAQSTRLKIFNLKKQPQDQGLATALVADIKATLAREEQVLVFVNRRGFAPTLYCPDCGWMAECKRCDAKMTTHQKPPYLHCHHCDTKQALPRQCPNCMSQHIQPVGAGTERLEHFLEQQFPACPVIRVDRDSTANKHAMEALLKPVFTGEPCILVGTQMLAKGHHFPNVTLVITINVDSGFFSADFRAMEKTAQLLLQVTGRAGREAKAGTAIIQTEFAEHPMLNLLVREPYSALASALLQERKERQLPPFTFQVLVRADSHRPQEAEHFLHVVRQQLHQRLISTGYAGVTFLGPLPSPMELKAGRFRSQLWINSQNRTVLHRFLNQSLTELYQLKGFHRIRWSIDVDPTENA